MPSPCAHRVGQRYSALCPISVQRASLRLAAGGPYPADAAGVESRRGRRSVRILPGKSYPLGAHWDGEGVNFAVFTEAGEAVDLCLFEQGRETARLRLPEITAHVHHGYVSGLGPGQEYGFRVLGDYDPERGLRFNAAKLLLDPYAHAITGKPDWSGPIFGYSVGDPAADLSR